jgi:hypothetical protein
MTNQQPVVDVLSRAYMTLHVTADDQEGIDLAEAVLQADASVAALVAAARAAANYIHGETYGYRDDAEVSGPDEILADLSAALSRVEAR